MRTGPHSIVGFKHGWASAWRLQSGHQSVRAVTNPDGGHPLLRGSRRLVRPPLRTTRWSRRTKSFVTYKIVQKGGQTGDAGRSRRQEPPRPRRYFAFIRAEKIERGTADEAHLRPGRSIRASSPFPGRYFNDAQTAKATTDARTPKESAGLEVRCGIINEPERWGMRSGLRPRQKTQWAGTIAVVHLLGGGTLDISILSRSGDGLTLGSVFEVKSQIVGDHTSRWRGTLEHGARQLSGRWSAQEGGRASKNCANDRLGLAAPEKRPAEKGPKIELSSPTQDRINLAFIHRADQTGPTASERLKQADAVSPQVRRRFGWSTISFQTEPSSRCRKGAEGIDWRG